MTKLHFSSSLIKFNLIFILIILFFGQIQAQFPPETVYGVPVNPSQLPMPSYLGSVQDLDHSLEITRLGDVAAFSDFYGSPLSYSSTLHQYAKTQAWNADMSLLHFGTIFFLNGDDYTLFKTISWAGLDDGRWSNTEPDIFYFCNGVDFKKINVNTEVVTLLHSFPDYNIARIGPYEGHLSADDRYVIITDADANSRGTKATVYDIVNNQTLGTFSGHFDWASMTPSGDYVVVSNDDTGQIERYDLNFQNMFVVKNGQQHGDFAVDVNGDEVWVQVIPLSMTRLSDGLFTDLLPATASTSGTCGYNYYNPNIAGHISGRNFGLPGWAIVSSSTHLCSNNPMLYDWRTEIFAIKLDYSGLGTIRHYGYSRATAAHGSVATVSPNGEKILFASDWDMYGDGGADILTYLVEYNQALPVQWLSPLTAKIINEQTHLNWTVASQVNNKHFAIEHSTNGFQFKTIGEIKGENELMARKEYTFIHQSPSIGENYYRVKQIDFDGQFDYLNMVDVFFEKGKISIYPNPTTGQLTIYSSIYDSFTIYNHLGEKIEMRKLVLGNNSVDLSSYDSGIYFIKTNFGQVEKVIMY